MAKIDEFLKALERPVTELPDLELEDIGEEDAETKWHGSNEKTISESRDEDALSERRSLLMTSDLTSGRYAGKKISVKSYLSNEGITELAKPTPVTADSNPEGQFGKEDSSVNGDIHTDDSDNEESESGSDRLSNASKDPLFNNRQSVDDYDSSQKVMTSFSYDTQFCKASSVRSQLRIWDRFMHLHILMHASLRSFNQLPRGKLAKQLKQSAIDETIKNYKLALRNMLEVSEVLSSAESILLHSSKQTKNLVTVESARDVGSDDEEIYSSAEEESDECDDVMNSGESDDVKEVELIDSENNARDSAKNKIFSRKRRRPLQKTAVELVKRHKEFEPFRITTLTKWGERTRLVAVGETKNSKNDFSGFESMILKQIDQILSDKSRLIHRTQMKRCDAERIGNNQESTFDEEIFDDDDFYQQLLKELIERKTTGVVDPIEISRQWLEIQNLRQKRSKRKKVDTKASKGRKIRYTVIPKLVNFFPSMPETVKWSDETRNQLFKSLFRS